ncbi:helix-turn-helix domain-containing protein [Erwinia papayae]|uniref:Helix-turn-helix domain-containing protein n=1 Tax=Erwinia papayae TaxID=206499 RepID=A0ABV3N3D7_9GAMM
MSTVGQRIRKRRKEKKITQKQLASLVGASASAVTQWELDATQPKGENLIKIATLLECSPEWIISGDEKSLPLQPKTTGFHQLKNVNSVPLLTWKEAAEYQPKDGFGDRVVFKEWVDTAQEVPAGSFALKVMEGMIDSPFGLRVPQGAVLIVEPRISDIYNSSGKIALVKNQKDNSITLRKLFIDGNDVYPLPLNPAIKNTDPSEHDYYFGIVKQIIINF